MIGFMPNSINFNAANNPAGPGPTMITALAVFNGL